MSEYEFTLIFSLPECNEPSGFVDALYEHGCDDALVGVARAGEVALDFNRAAESAVEALLSALSAVKAAISGASLIEVRPDLAGISDVAQTINCSRQNVRQLIQKHPRRFPAPVHSGNPSLWHLCHVLTWLQERGDYSIARELVEVSEAAMQCNLRLQMKELNPAIADEFTPVL